MINSKCMNLKKDMLREKKQQILYDTFIIYTVLKLCCIDNDMRILVPERNLL